MKWDRQQYIDQIAHVFFGTLAAWALIQIPIIYPQSAVAIVILMTHWREAFQHDLFKGGKAGIGSFVDMQFWVLGSTIGASLPQIETL